MEIKGASNSSGFRGVVDLNFYLLVLVFVLIGAIAPGMSLHVSAFIFMLWNDVPLFPFLHSNLARQDPLMPMSK